MREALERSLRSQDSPAAAAVAGPGPQVRMPRTPYVAAVRAALEAIQQGESYEICLTTQITHHLPQPVRG